MKLFDSHVHLDDAAFDADRDAVLARAAEAGVTRLVTVGSDIASSRAAIALAERYAGVYAAVAIHPHSAAEASAGALAELDALASQPKVVAVGETGLDYGGRSAPVAAQRKTFEAHLALARDRRLPVVIHCRDAHRDVLDMLDMLEEKTAPSVVMHAFSGSLEIAQECAARGYFISLAGPVTFRNATVPVDIARVVPLSLLLVETDAPVLTPEPYRGKRNEPAYLRFVVERIAKLRELTVEDVGGASSTNAARAFRV